MTVSSAPPSIAASDGEFGEEDCVQAGMPIGESSFRGFSVAEDGSTPVALPPPSAPRMDDVTPLDKGMEGGAKVGVRRMKGTHKTWHFKVIVVGESGLGKTTAIECLTAGLCASKPRDAADPDQGASGISAKTIEIQEGKPFEIVSEDKNVKIMLTIVDTPGYGDKVDCSLDMDSICDYIEKQWESYRDADKGVTVEEHDSIVTCCLYFIAPHRLKAIDTAFLRRVSAKVPCIPVIAKSDTMTKEEASAFRAEVATTLASHREIQLYDWRYEEDGDEKVLDNGVAAYRKKHERQEHSPFTIVASSGKRIYPWGECDPENEDHSDFSFLRRLVLQEHLYAMKGKAVESYKAWEEGLRSAAARLAEEQRLAAEEARLSADREVAEERGWVGGIVLAWRCKEMERVPRAGLRPFRHRHPLPPLRCALRQRVSQQAAHRPQGIRGVGTGASDLPVGRLPLQPSNRRCHSDRPRRQFLCSLLFLRLSASKVKVVEEPRLSRGVPRSKQSALP